MILSRQGHQQSISLEDGFLWSDEFDWQAIEQKQERAIDGSLIIQEGKKKLGRPMTLISPDGQGWVKRHVLSQLFDWSLLQEVFHLSFNYPHDQRKFKVIFNHQQGAITAEPVKGIASVSDDEYYQVTLKFLIVE